MGKRGSGSQHVLVPGTGPTKTCRSTRTASGAIELLLKAAGTQGAQGTQT